MEEEEYNRAKKDKKVKKLMKAAAARPEKAVQKFGVPENPLILETQIPELLPPEGMLRSKQMKFLGNRISDDIVSEFERVGYGKIKAQLQYDDFTKSVKKAFKEEFQEWLQGRSKYNVMKWPGGNWKNRLRTPWGPKALTHMPDVRDYLTQHINKRMEFKIMLTLLYMTGPRSLPEAWLYFKYIVCGMDMPYDQVSFMSEYTMFTDYYKKGIGFAMPTHEETAKRRRDSTEFEHFFGDGRFDATNAAFTDNLKNATEWARENIFNDMNDIDPEVRTLFLNSYIDLLTAASDANVDTTGILGGMTDQERILMELNTPRAVDMTTVNYIAAISTLGAIKKMTNNPKIDDLLGRYHGLLERLGEEREHGIDFKKNPDAYRKYMATRPQALGKLHMLARAAGAGAIRYKGGALHVPMYRNKYTGQMEAAISMNDYDSLDEVRDEIGKTRSDFFKKDDDDWSWGSGPPSPPDEPPPPPPSSKPKQKKPRERRGEDIEIENVPILPTTTTPIIPKERRRGLPPQLPQDIQTYKPAPEKLNSYAKEDVKTNPPNAKDIQKTTTDFVNSGIKEIMEQVKRDSEIFRKTGKYPRTAAPPPINPFEHRPPAPAPNPAPPPEQAPQTSGKYSLTDIQEPAPQHQPRPTNLPLVRAPRPVSIAKVALEKTGELLGNLVYNAFKNAIRVGGGLLSGAGQVIGAVVPPVARTTASLVRSGAGLLAEGANAVSTAVRSRSTGAFDLSEIQRDFENEIDPRSQDPDLFDITEYETNEENLNEHIFEGLQEELADRPGLLAGGQATTTVQKLIRHYHTEIIGNLRHRMNRIMSAFNIPHDDAEAFFADPMNQQNQNRIINNRNWRGLSVAGFLRPYVYLRGEIPRMQAIRTALSYNDERTRNPLFRYLSDRVTQNANTHSEMARGLFRQPHLINLLRGQGNWRFQTVAGRRAQPAFPPPPAQQPVAAPPPAQVPFHPPPPPRIVEEEQEAPRIPYNGPDIEIENLPPLAEVVQEAPFSYVRDETIQNILNNATGQPTEAGTRAYYEGTESRMGSFPSAITENIIRMPRPTEEKMRPPLSKAAYRAQFHKTVLNDLFGNTPVPQNIEIPENLASFDVNRFTHIDEPFATREIFDAITNFRMARAMDSANTNPEQLTESASAEAMSKLNLLIAQIETLINNHTARYPGGYDDQTYEAVRTKTLDDYKRREAVIRSNIPAQDYMSFGDDLVDTVHQLGNYIYTASISEPRNPQESIDVEAELQPEPTGIPRIVGEELSEAKRDFINYTLSIVGQLMGNHDYEVFQTLIMQAEELEGEKSPNKIAAMNAFYQQNPRKLRSHFQNGKDRRIIKAAAVLKAMSKIQNAPQPAGAALQLILDTLRTVR